MDRDPQNNSLCVADGSVPAARNRLGRSEDREREAVNELMTLPTNNSEYESGAVLLAQLASVFSRHLILPKGGAEAAALWTIHAHAHDAAHISPILAVTSPEMRCGKTTLLEILQAVTPNAVLTCNVTAPAIFHLVDRYAPTLLVDEADTFLRSQEQMRGILNSGHRKSSATIVRIDPGRTPRPYRTWSPKVIACIGNLPETLSDRSVIIRLQRKRRDECVERFGRDTLKYLARLRSYVSRWAKAHFEVLLDANPEIPMQLHDRAADNWRALLAIADEIGGSWPAIARSAAIQLSADGDGAATPAAGLLADIREVFAKSNLERIESRLLALALASQGDGRWAEWRNGKPITTPQLAAILKPFGINPKTVRFGNRTAKGYLAEDFADAFERYI